MIDEEKFESKDKPKAKYTVRTPTDIQRIKLEKLMENPNKPVLIPQTTNKQKNFMTAIPTFVRNVMGSSAGAGSGEFHVYRHLRRKEYARQKFIQHKSKQETLDDEHQNRIDQNRLQADAKTAKKRAKRLKKKKNQLNKRQQNKNKVATGSAEATVESNEDDSDDEDEDITDKPEVNLETEKCTNEDVEQEKQAVLTMNVEEDITDKPEVNLDTENRTNEDVANADEDITDKPEVNLETEKCSNEDVANADEDITDKPETENRTNEDVEQEKKQDVIDNKNVVEATADVTNNEDIVEQNNIEQKASAEHLAIQEKEIDAKVSATAEA